MRKYARTACAAGSLVATTMGCAGQALAMPTPVGSAQEVVGALRASGYEVVVNKLGTASLDRCMVTAVRSGPEVAEKVTEGGGGTVEMLSHTTVYVDVKC